jgi:hypothetical protein
MNFPIIVGSFEIFSLKISQINLKQENIVKNNFPFIFQSFLKSINKKVNKN